MSPLCRSGHALLHQPCNLGMMWAAVLFRSRHETISSSPSLAAFLCTMGLDAALSEAIRLRLPRQTLRAGQVLLAQGSEQEAAFYIEAGIARACHYTRDGQERCKEFYFEGELCLLYDSWLTGSLARYQLEALTELQVVRVPLALLEEPAWQPVCMALLRHPNHEDLLGQ